MPKLICSLECPIVLEASGVPLCLEPAMSHCARSQSILYNVPLYLELVVSKCPIVLGASKFLKCPIMPGASDEPLKCSLFNFDFYCLSTDVMSFLWELTDY